MRIIMSVAALLLTSVVAQARSIRNDLESTDKRSLAAGQYIITLEKDDECQSGEMNIAKELIFDQSNLSLDAVLLRHDSTATDNLMHAAVCQSGKLTAEIVLDLPNPATLVAQSYQLDKELRIVKVELVKRVASDLAINNSQVTLTKGRHLLRLSGMGSCRESEINTKKHYEYSESTEDVAIQISRGSDVLDNLIRPMVCHRFAPTRAKIIVDVKEDLVIEAQDGLNLVSAQQILAIKTITNNNADRIACFENSGRPEGLVVILSVENEAVTSAKISKNENQEASLNFCAQNRHGSIEASCKGTNAPGYKLFVARGKDRVILSKWDRTRGLVFRSLSCSN